MSDPPTVRLVLELEPGSEAPEGLLTDDAGAVTAFRGWLELMDAVEHARRRTSREDT